MPDCYYCSSKDFIDYPHGPYTIRIWGLISHRARKQAILFDGNSIYIERIDCGVATNKKALEKAARYWRKQLSDSREDRDGHRREIRVDH